ncbi:MAG: hypothetical protein HPY45_06595 [Anaerolineae bacterium]|nr:hypothetical protein [Anaerolineae bacterium]
MFITKYEAIAQYRAHTFCTLPHLRVKTIHQAIEFVNQRGFVFFWPIKGIILPSLWVSAAGERPVPDWHDDPGHITWQWKDALLGKRCWYYARILRRRNTIVSLETIPYFYALSPNYGDYEHDYLEQYAQGFLTQEAKSLYEALLKQGPLDTLSLRKAARLTSRESDARFNRALDDLQIELKILPVGISQAGAWHYAFIYDIVPRHFVDLPEKAREISVSQARTRLIEMYLLSIGAAQPKDITHLFGWKPEVTQSTITALIKDNRIIEGAVEGMPGHWLFTPHLANI